MSKDRQRKKREEIDIGLSDVIGIIGFDCDYLVDGQGEVPSSFIRDLIRQRWINFGKKEGNMRGERF